MYRVIATFFVILFITVVANIAGIYTVIYGEVKAALALNRSVADHEAANPDQNPPLPRYAANTTPTVTPPPHGWDLPALYLNMDHRTDRRLHIEDVLKSVGFLHIERFSGINLHGDKSVTDGLCSFTDRKGKFQRNRRCVSYHAVRLDHMRMLDRAMEANWPAVAIFEDDFTLTKWISPQYLREIIAAIMEQRPEWDVIGPSFNPTDMKRSHTRQVQTSEERKRWNCAPNGCRVSRVERAWTTGGFIARQRALRAIYDSINETNCPSGGGLRRN